MSKIADQIGTVRRLRPYHMSMSDLAAYGGGKIAYIKVITTSEATEMFPRVEGIPENIPLYALLAADGTPLALTDTHRAAVKHAVDDDLEVSSLQ